MRKKGDEMFGSTDQQTTLDLCYVKKELSNALVLPSTRCFMSFTLTKNKKKKRTLYTQ